MVFVISDRDEEIDWQFDNGHTREYSGDQDRFSPQSENSDMNYDHVVNISIASNDEQACSQGCGTFRGQISECQSCLSARYCSGFLISRLWVW